MADLTEVLSDLGLPPNASIQIVAAAQVDEALQQGMSPGYLLAPIGYVLITGVTDMASARHALSQIYPAGHRLSTATRPAW